jgi:hypothetical protein
MDVSKPPDGEGGLPDVHPGAEGAPVTQGAADEPGTAAASPPVRPDEGPADALIPEAPPEGEAVPGRSKKPLWIAIGVAAVVIVIGIVVAAIVAKNRVKVSMPASIAGQPQFHDSGFDTSVQGQLSKIGGSAKAGVFGTPSKPEFFVIAAKTGAPPFGSDPLSSVGSGFTSGVCPGCTASIDTSAATKTTVGGVHYECAPYSIQSTSSGASLSASLCVWWEGKTLGAVFFLDPSLDALSVTQQAYAAVVS